MTKLFERNDLPPIPYIEDEELHSMVSSLAEASYYMNKVFALMLRDKLTIEEVMDKYGSDLGDCSLVIEHWAKNLGIMENK